MLLSTNLTFAQAPTTPYLKSCQDRTQDSERTNCTKIKLGELLKAEFEKTDAFEVSDENLEFNIELEISARGRMSFSGCECNHDIKSYLSEAISNIGYKVLMRPAIQNEKKVETKIDYLIIIENYQLKKNTPAEVGAEDKSYTYSKDYSDDMIYKVVDIMPRFPGCEDSDDTDKEKEDCAKGLMLEYIYDNLQATRNGYDEHIQGLYVIQFIVDVDGDLVDLNFVRTLGDCDQCEERMKEVLQSMPLWKPGVHKGEKARVLYTLPIKYKRE